jgi:hypothetical protein
VAEPTASWQKMGEKDDIINQIEKLICCIREKNITLSKQGKERLISKFPTLKEEIRKIEETGGVDGGAKNGDRDVIPFLW